MSTRNATVKATTTMNPEDQNPQAPLQSPVENGAVARRSSDQAKERARARWEDSPDAVRAARFIAGEG